MKEIQVPTHPIPSMQGAFAESMQEASAASTPNIPNNRLATAAARRQLLIDQDVSEETHAARWRQKPGQQHHQLWKLMAQISFGIYLLLNGIARDENQVMTILQGHVDEVDEFLQTTLDDFELAQDDIDERLKFLRLPLENIAIFDAMLEDRTFRLQIVNGNERIEHVIHRTAAAMNDALKDVQQGLDACKEFTIYLAQEMDSVVWRNERPDMEEVFEGMKGNVEGWYKAYVSLQTKGNHLGVALVQLGSIVAEMDRRAGEVSRKTRVRRPNPILHKVSLTIHQFSISPVSSPMNSPPASPPQQSRQMRQSMLKTLPTDPTMITPAIRATLPAFQLVQDRERTPEPEEQSQHSSAEPELEPEFILAPRTYTPVPSPQPPQAAIQEAAPPPEIRQRSSLRNRFSLKRKETPQEIVLQPPPPLTENYWGPRQRVYSSSAPRPDSIPRNHNAVPSLSSPVPRERSANTPPSRGLDSAYCSDFEKPLSPPTAPHPSQLTQTISNSPRIPPARIDSPPVLSQSFLPSPRSDQQFFRPVNASPNSPLQRPWTAAPGPNHIHSHSAGSNGSGSRHVHTPSALGNRRGAPSAMGMSMMSDMTTVTENGKKVKKKRSAFGWLKKAFALSEEEKAAFEERRRGTDWEQERYYERPQPRWIDGKRVR